MNLPIHGTIRYIREILSEPSAHSSVRTFGTYGFPLRDLPFAYFAELVISCNNNPVVQLGFIQLFHSKG